MAPTVLMNAGPWLPVPPPGYGGIENVVATLVPALRARGARVVLCAAAGATLEVDELVETMPAPMFEHIAGPYNQMSGIAHAHMQQVVRRLRADPGGIDVVHDHVEVVGASTLAAMAPAVPPVLHTLHWDLRKHPDFYGTFDGAGRVVFNALSDLQLAAAPENLRRQVLAVVPLAVRVDEFPFAAEKRGAFLHLSRIFRAKGQHAAARVCRERGLPLDLAGPVAYATTPEQLDAELADRSSPLHDRPDVRYFLEDVRPLLDGDHVRWIGALAGHAKLDALAAARALLMPITWDEPGATVVIEAMACGTPVIGMRRRALPMLVEHGVNGFLADSEEEFAACLDRVEEIEPAACRRIAAERYDAPVMARAYLALYERVLGG